MRFIYIVFFLLVTFTCRAQDQSQSKFHFGPRIGYQFSNFTKEKHSGYQPGFYGGGFASYSLFPALEVEMDVLYSETGGSRLTIKENPPGLDDPIARETTTSHTSLKGLEIPMLVHFFPWSNSNSPVKPFVTAGPSLGILMYGRARQESTLELNTTSFPPLVDPVYGPRPIATTVVGSENVTSEYHRYNFGGVVGIGLHVPFNRFSIRLDLRYRRGFTVIDSSYNPQNLVTNSSNLRSNSIALSAGIIF